MPRYKFVESKYFMQYNEIGYFKIEYPDFLYDFKLIYQDLINYFKDFNCVELFQPKYDMLCKLNIKPALSNRTYIVTNFDHVVFAMVDMDEAVIDNLIDLYDRTSMLFDNAPDKVMTSYISTLYIFKGDKMHTNTQISPFKMAQLISVFKKENLINYEGARDDYYAKPRREHKKLLAQNSADKTT